MIHIKQLENGELDSWRILVMVSFIIFFHLCFCGLRKIVPVFQIFYDTSDKIGYLVSKYN